MTHNPVILIVRPEPQASRFAGELRAVTGAAADVIVAPLMASRFFGEPIDGNRYSAAVFTSETGVTGAARLWTGTMGMAFAVGNRTAEAASALGWLCESADGAGPELAELIAASGLGGTLIWPKGRQGGASFIEAAEKLGLSIEPRVVYEQDEVDPLPAAFSELAGRRVILPLFSPRSAKVARGRLSGDLVGQVETVAISEAAARAWGAPVSRVAARPNGAAMIRAIVAILDHATT